MKPKRISIKQMFPGGTFNSPHAALAASGVYGKVIKPKAKPAKPTPRKK